MVTIPLIISASGTISTSGELETYQQFSLQFPALDRTTVTVQGTVSGGTFTNIYDEFGQQVLYYPNADTSTNFVVGSQALRYMEGLFAIRIVLSAPQNSGAKTIFLRKSTRYR